MSVFSAVCSLAVILSHRIRISCIHAWDVQVEHTHDTQLHLHRYGIVPYLILSVPISYLKTLNFRPSIDL